MTDGTGRCPRCGAEVIAGARFCGRCGLDLLAPLSPGPVASSGASRRLAELAAGRAGTDEVLSALWVILPLIAVIAGVFLGVLLLFAQVFSVSAFIFLGGGVVAVALLLILNYKLIDRRNKHIAREAAVRRAMIEHIWARGQERGTANAIYPYVAALEAIDQQGHLDERPQSLLWSAAFLIPLIGIILNFYMLYFLSKFAFEHDDRWHAFAYNVHLASAINGEQVPPPPPKFPQERSFILYLILTIIISVFLIYWYFKLIDDPNKHFQEMWAFEDGFRAATERAP